MLTSDDVQLRTIRARLLREFTIRPRIYWIDLGVSASVAWGSGITAALAPIAIVPFAIVVSALATLRAAYFIHDISHLRRQLFAFEATWNLLVGAWIQMPSFMADPHVDHHDPATYGTANDPEYERVATWSRLRIITSIAIMPVVPILLAFRYGVIGPLSWLHPFLRALVWSRMSSLQTNPQYVRSIGEPFGKRTITLELFATAVVVGVAIATVHGSIPLRGFLVWWAITTLALALNQARTLIAHAYESSGDPCSLVDQVADSSTCYGPAWSTGLVFPVGTQFHALHHLAPSLPYHALRAAHDRACQLGAPRALTTSVSAGYVSGLAGLWRRASPTCSRGRSAV